MCCLLVDICFNSDQIGHQDASCNYWKSFFLSPSLWRREKRVDYIAGHCLVVFCEKILLSLPLLQRERERERLSLSLSEGGEKRVVISLKTLQDILRCILLSVPSSRESEREKKTLKNYRKRLDHQPDRNWSRFQLASNTYSLCVLRCARAPSASACTHAEWLLHIINL